MARGLIAICVLAAVQVCAGRAAYEVAVPVFRQPYGDEDPLIIGGEPAKRGQLPHVVDINVDLKGFCAGSLISKNWILTAGHCVDGFKSWILTLGVTDRLAGEPGRIKIGSVQAIRHENYDKSTLNNDVALILIPISFDFTEYIKPIALPPRSLKNENLAGKTARVSGWGKTSDDSTQISSVLRWADLVLISNEECKKVFGDIIIESKYCCSTVNQKSTCNGDSGGSLTIGKGPNLVHLGIVSFGSDAGCSKGYPVGFTATPYFLDWISNKTRIPIQD